MTISNTAIADLSALVAMMNTDTIQLENIDPEDIGDILIKLEKSFGIKYNNDAFKEAETFGDICDIIEDYIGFEHKEDCTTQQAFYKIRKAISQTLIIEEKSIQLENDLEYLFPPKGRRSKLIIFQQHLGIKLDILRMKDGLVRALFSGFVFSLVAFFFNWKVAISGLTFFYTASIIAGRFSNELTIRTVRELTQKAARENYLALRRQKATVNKNEIFRTIQETFSSELGLDKGLLTRNASLGWYR